MLPLPHLLGPDKLAVAIAARSARPYSSRQPGYSCIVWKLLPVGRTGTQWRRLVRRATPPPSLTSPATTSSSRTPPPSRYTGTPLLTLRSQADQKGRMGILLDFLLYEPLTYTIEGEYAAHRGEGVHPWLVWHASHSHYPETIQKLVGMRLLNFIEEQTKLVQGSTNIIGINHYIAYYVKQHENLTCMTYADDWQTQLLYEHEMSRQLYTASTTLENTCHLHYWGKQLKHWKKLRILLMTHDNKRMGC